MRKSFLFSILTCLCASGAAAQEPPFDIRATLDCLDFARDTAAREACVGLSANRCIDTPAGGSTVGMGYCLDRERGFWDDRLNAVYRELRAREQQRDRDHAGMPGAGNLAETLRAMQRAWIPWRDATCDYERAQWTGGTGGGPATLGCLLRLTARQALYLETMMTEY